MKSIIAVMLFASVGQPACPGSKRWSPPVSWPPTTSKWL